MLCSRVHFTFIKAVNKLISIKILSSHRWSICSRHDSHNLITIGSKLEPFNRNLSKYPFFINTRSHSTMLSKKIDNIEFVQGLNFEFIHLLKNNGTINLLTFDDSCDEFCHSNVFVDIATAGRRRRLSTIYIRHNLFHQSKLGRDVELQKTHLVLFKSPGGVMQVNTPSAQLGLGSELVDWYREATLLPWGHLMIDLSPRTTDRFCYCTNNGSSP